MAITPQFSKSDVKAYVEKHILAYRTAVLNRLKQAGEKFVALARTNGEYTDQTGNLRSSVGYIIMYDGLPLFENFKQVMQGNEGVEKGKRSALDNAPSKGYALVGVAGMDYAAAVESKGKDVITGSSQIIEEWLKNALIHLKGKL